MKKTYKVKGIVDLLKENGISREDFLFKLKKISKIAKGSLKVKGIGKIEKQDYINLTFRPNVSLVELDYNGIILNFSFGSEFIKEDNEKEILLHIAINIIEGDIEDVVKRENLFSILDKNEVEWELPELFLYPIDITYSDKEYRQVKFITDVVSKIMKYQDVSTTLETTSNYSGFYIRSLRNEESEIIWNLPEKDERLKKYRNSFGYYWGSIKFILRFMPLPEYALVEYFDSFSEDKEYYDMVGGMKRRLYLTVLEDENAKDILVYTSPEDKRKAGEKPIITIRKYKTLNNPRFNF